MAKPKEFVISQEQAREFARLIYADISKYVKNHNKEFEQFIEEENKVEEDLK